jgi:hypothetical protein
VSLRKHMVHRTPGMDGWTSGVFAPCPMVMRLAKLQQQMANSAIFYSHLTSNYIVLWRHHLGRYKGSYWGLAGFSYIPFWIWRG